MKILFVTSNRLGDSVLSTGLLDHLIRTYPDARFTVVCGPVAEGVFTRMPNRDRTIVLRKQSYGRHWLPLWATTVTRLWDLVVDIRGSALSWLVPTRNRAVFRRIDGPKIAQLGAILRLAPPPLPVAWTVQADRDYIADLLQIDPVRPPEVATCDVHRPEQTPPNARPIIVLAPTANWQPKVWPGGRFAETFRSLATTTIADARPVVLGGEGPVERAMAAPLLAALPDALDLVGALSLPQAAALLQRSALFIGNDSGLMHLAAAANAPTIGLFGPTDAATYAPAGPLATAVTAASMQAITVPQVLEASKRLLRTRPNR